MSTTRQTRGGRAAWVSSFIGSARQIFVNTTTGDVHVGDGATPGGFGGKGILQRAKDYADSILGVAPLPRGQINGLTIQNNVSDAGNDLDILPGAARNDADNMNMVLVTTITKQVDALWVAGNNQGGRDASTKNNNATYHVYIVSNPSTGATDVLFSEAPSNPDMTRPNAAGFTQKQHIGSIPMVSGSFVAFKQVLDYFGLVTPSSQPAGVVSGAVNKSLAGFPIGKKFKAHLTVVQGSATNSSFFGFKDPDEGVATVADYCTSTASTGLKSTGTAEVFTNSLGQVYYYGFRTDTTCDRVDLRGWTDPRGRRAA